jgi:HK97 family phage major capsid protein
MKDGLEGEIGKELSRSLPVTWGTPVPIFAFERDLTAANSSQLIGQGYTGKDVLSYLQARSCVLSAGARLVTNCKANMSLPRQNQTAQVQWNQENQGIARTNPTFDNATVVNFSRASVVTAFSKMLLQEATVSKSFQEIVIKDLVAAMATAVDAAALAGSSTNNQPTGLLNMPTGSGYANVSAVTLSAPVTWKDVLFMQAAPENQNVWATDNTAAWILSPAAKQTLKGAPKTTQGFQRVRIRGRPRRNRWSKGVRDYSTVGK